MKYKRTYTYELPSNEQSVFTNVVRSKRIATPSYFTNTESHAYEYLDKLTLTILTLYLMEKKKINSTYERSTYKHICSDSSVVCVTDRCMAGLFQVLTLGHDHKVAVWPAGAPPRGAVSLSSCRQPTIAARTKSTSITIITSTIQKREEVVLLSHFVVCFSSSTPIFICFFFSQLPSLETFPLSYFLSLHIQATLSPVTLFLLCSKSFVLFLMFSSLVSQICLSKS